MTWDAEIWAPCRLGEAFTLWDLGYNQLQFLRGIQADWMDDHGAAECVATRGKLMEPNPYGVRMAGPRPWTTCWNYEPKIKITPPTWCWDWVEDRRFGLELKPKKNGSRRRVKLGGAMIYMGKPVYRVIVEMDGMNVVHLDSIPALDPYFAPIWPVPMEPPTELPDVGSWYYYQKQELFPY